MFYKSKASKNGKLRLPPLDLRSCRCMDMAFSYTNVVNVKLEHTDNIQSAVDCYTQCPYLVNYPPTMFPKVKTLSKLTSGKAYIDMFAGCDQLTNPDLATGGGDANFDELLKQTEEYYRKAEDEEMFDADGYFKITGPDSLRGEYYADNKERISKIRMYTEGSKSLFDRDLVDGVYAQEIDLNGIKDAAYIFWTAKFVRIPRLTGCQNVENAEGMFKDCDFAIAPNLDLPSVKKFKGIFDGCSNLHQLPKLTVGGAYDDEDGYDAFKGVDYVFGTNHEGAAEHIGLPRMEKFCRTVLEQIIGEVDIPGAADGEDGKQYSPRTSEIAEKYGSVTAFFRKLAYSAKSGAMSAIKKVVIDTDPQYMFKSYSGELPPVEFDEAAMKTGMWQPNGMFIDSHVKHIRLLNWPESFTDTSNMFMGASTDEALPEVDLSRVTNASYMYMNCTAGKPPKAAPSLKSLQFGDYMF